MKAIKVFVLLILCTLLIAAAPPEEVVFKDKVFVIDKNKTEAIKKIVNIKKPLSGGYSYTTLSIESTQVKACYQNNLTKTVCFKLLHPDTVGLKTEGAFFVKIESGCVDNSCKKAMTDLKTRISKSKYEDVWSMVLKKDIAQKKQSELLPIIETHLSNNQNDEASKLLEIAEKNGDDSTRFHLLKAQVLCRKLMFKDAENEITKITPTKENKQAILIEQARIAFYSEEINKGVSILLQIKPEIHEKDNLCMQMAGIINPLRTAEKSDQFYKTIKTFVKQISYCDEIWDGLARMMIDLGDSKELVPMLDKAIQKAPNNLVLLEAKVHALRRLKKAAPALPILRKLYKLKSDEKYITLHAKIASAGEVGDTEFNKYLSMMQEHPDNLLLKHTVAVCSYYRGDYERSKKLMTELRLKLKAEPRVFIYGAMSRYELGDWEGAKKWLDDLGNSQIEFDPDYYYCQAVLWSGKNHQKALGYLEKYLKIPLEPDSNPAKRERAYGYRSSLIKGEAIWEWIPSVDRPLMPKQYTWAILAVLSVLGILIGVVFIRRRVYSA